MKARRFLTQWLLAPLNLMGVMGLSGGGGGFSSPTNESERRFRSFLMEHEGKLAPLAQSSALAHWQATASGVSSDYEQLAETELNLNRLYTNREEFAELRALRASGEVKDPLLKRQLDLLYNVYLSTQFDEKLMEEIVTLSAQLGEHFNKYRATVHGVELSDNEVGKVLRHSDDVAYRQQVWEASKGIGRVVEADMLKLVRLRNQAAQQLGYANYYHLALESGEQNEDALFVLLNEMAERTDEPFRQLKTTLDKHLAQRFGISEAELRPWHYEDRFFQETPSAGSVDLDTYYANKDVVKLAEQFYQELGLPVDGVLQKSDLYGRSGKYQHAYCTDIDRSGDVRIMCSVVPSEHWMDTMLHELGHAVYDLGISTQPLPWLLRSAAHTFTTEGVANLMGRLSANAYWMQRYVGLSEEETRSLAPRLRARTCMGALIFARWCLVMAHFERQLYMHPEQDLNALWWQLVARYQGLTPPEGRQAPDWAAKIHLVSSPVYYHNYLLGDLYASQLHDTICRRFYPGRDPWTVYYGDHSEVGAFLSRAVFAPGARWRWDHFVEESTGEPLSPRSFAALFIPPSEVS